MFCGELDLEIVGPSFIEEVEDSNNGMQPCHIVSNLNSSSLNLRQQCGPE